MTLEQAKALRVGDHVASRWDVPEWTARRVTDHWISDDGLRVRVRLASFQQSDWIDPERFEKCPKMRTEVAPYRNGDVLAVEHRPQTPSTPAVQGVKEAVS